MRNKKNYAKTMRAWTTWRAAKFKTGMTVAVKPGTFDPDYPDTPLGGWVGVICDVDLQSRPRAYRLEWSQATRNQIHEAHRRRCERDGFDLEAMWLNEELLQECSGEPIPIEQPKDIPESDSAPAAGKRVRAIFGLTDEESLPDVNLGALRRYHVYLKTRLAIPFPASCSFEEETDLPLLITGLLHAEKMDPERGIECCAHSPTEGALAVSLADIKSLHANNRRLIEDYSSWYCGGLAEEAAATQYSDIKDVLALLGAVFAVLIAGTTLGVVFGAVLGVFEIARTTAMVGIGVVGLLGYLVGSYVSRSPKAERHLNLRPRLSNCTWLFPGLLVGGLVGSIAIVLPGALLGAAVCFLTARFVLRSSAKVWPPLVGALVGAVALAFWWDWEAALIGTGWGAAVGAITAAALCAAFAGITQVLRNRMKISG